MLTTLPHASPRALFVLPDLLIPQPVLARFATMLLVLPTIAQQDTLATQAMETRRVPLMLAVMTPLQNVPLLIKCAQPPTPALMSHAPQPVPSALTTQTFALMMNAYLAIVTMLVLLLHIATILQRITESAQQIVLMTLDATIGKPVPPQPDNVLEDHAQQPVYLLNALTQLETTLPLVLLVIALHALPLLLDLTLNAQLDNSAPLEKLPKHLMHLVFAMQLNA